MLAQDNAAGHKTLERRYEVVDMFWSEKLRILVDYAQLCAVLYHWENAWPQRWRSILRPLLLFNLDFVTIQDASKLDPYIPRAASQPAYMLVVVCWIMFILLLQSLVVYLRRQQLRSRYESTHRYNMRELKAIKLLDVLYCPFLVSILSLCKCTAQPSACPSWLTCWIFVGFALPFGLALPLEVYRLVRRNRTNPDSVDHHESEVRFREIEFLLGLDQGVFPPHFLLYSSFTRTHMYFRCFVLMRKLSVLLFVWILPPPIVGVLLLVQAIGVLAWYTSSPAFRVDSSNKVLLITESHLLFTLYLGTLRSYGVQNPLLLDSSATVVHVVLMIVLLTAYGYHGISWARKRRKFSSPCWPTPKHYIYNLLNDEQVVSWLHALEETNMLLLAKLFTPESVYPVHTVQDLLERVRVHRKEASTNDTMFATPLEMAEFRLAAVHNKFKSASAFGQEEFIKNSEKFARIASKRSRETVLMHPKKSKILGKLLAVRTWVEHREMSLRDAHPSFFWSNPRTLEEVKAICKLVLEADDSSTALQLLESWREKLLGWVKYWPDRPQDDQLPEDLAPLIANVDAAIVRQLK